MRKNEELTHGDSCMSRAKDDEHTFVLLGRDVAVPETIRFWAARRVALGKNEPDDMQIVRALAGADEIEREQAGLPQPKPWDGVEG